MKNRISLCIYYTQNREHVLSTSVWIHWLTAITNNYTAATRQFVNSISVSIIWNSLDQSVTIAMATVWDWTGQHWRHSGVAVGNRTKHGQVFDESFVQHSIVLLNNKKNINNIRTWSTLSNQQHHSMRVSAMECFSSKGKTLIFDCSPDPNPVTEQHRTRHN